MPKPALLRVLPVLLLNAAALAACGSDYNKTTGPSKVNYAATLRASNEVTAAGASANVSSSGTGTWTGVYDPAAKTLTYTLSVSGLSAGSTAGHIHGPAASTTTAGVIVPFAVAAGQTSGSPLASGVIDLSKPVNATGTVSGDSLIKLMDAGLTYANVHTSAYGAGEIRGQITKQ